MIRPEQITNQIAVQIAMRTIARAKQDWYVLISQNAPDEDFNEIRAFFKHEGKFYCSIIDLYFKIGNGEENCGIYCSAKQLLQELENDKQNHIIKVIEVNEIL